MTQPPALGSYLPRHEHGMEAGAVNVGHKKTSIAASALGSPAWVVALYAVSSVAAVLLVLDWTRGRGPWWRAANLLAAAAAGPYYLLYAALSRCLVGWQVRAVEGTGQK